jgi:uncharacterized protein
MPWDIAVIFVFLAVVIPWRGTVRLRKLLEIPEIGSRERIALYLTTIAFQWLLAVVVAWRAWARGYSLSELGLTVSNPSVLVLSAVLGGTFLGAFQWANLRRAGRMGSSTSGTIRQVARKILPRTPAEAIPYFALAATAGVCEEFLYRGFAMAALARLGLNSWLVVVLTAILFGLAHLYQGRSGLVGTSLVGLILGAARLLLGSMLPMVLWHAVIDAVAGVAGRRYLLKGEVELSI